jgi:hypothetical protein
MSFVKQVQADSCGSLMHRKGLTIMAGIIIAETPSGACSKFLLPDNEKNQA